MDGWMNERTADDGRPTDRSRSLAEPASHGTLSSRPSGSSDAELIGIPVAFACSLPRTLSRPGPRPRPPFYNGCWNVRLRWGLAGSFDLPPPSLWLSLHPACINALIRTKLIDYAILTPLVSTPPTTTKTRAPALLCCGLVVLIFSRMPPRDLLSLGSPSVSVRLQSDSLFHPSVPMKRVPRQIASRAAANNRV